MLCSSCAPMHGYGDSICITHHVDSKWKGKLIDYKSKDGIPGNMTFLFGESYLTLQEASRNQSGRHSRISAKSKNIDTNSVIKPRKKGQLQKSALQMMLEQGHHKGERE